MPPVTHFNASEALEIAVTEQAVPIHHYLRQPQRLVRAIAEPSLMEQLSESQFRLKMQTVNFLEMYHFQPTVILRVWADGAGTVRLASESCEIRGIDSINNRFSLQVRGKLAPERSGGQTYLHGRADLAVQVALPPPLWLTPAPFLEVAGNGLLKGILRRIKQRLLRQLLKDYGHWANQTSPAALSAHDGSILKEIAPS